MRIDAVFIESAAERAKQSTDSWEELLEGLVENCHPEQRAFVLDPGRYVGAIVGRGGGKTHGGIVRFLRRMMKRKGAKCFYVALTKDHAREIIWVDLKNTLRGLGFVEDKDVVYNETKLSATLTRNGSSLRLVGADKQHDIDKLRGPTYAEVGIDEMGAQTDKIVRYLIDEVVGARLVGAIWFAGTAGIQPQGLWYEITGPEAPLGRLWAERETESAKMCSVHRWSLESAVQATRDRPIPALLELQENQKLEIAAKGLTRDNPKYRREYLAEWAQDATEAIYKYRPALDDGMPWNQWDPPREGQLRVAVLPAEFKEWVHVVSLDLGSSDPTSINVFATALDDKTCTIYHRYGFEQKRLYARPIAELLLGEHRDHSQPAGIIGAIGKWPNGMVADSTHLGVAVLDELSDVYGIAIEPAEKGWRYKLGAIEVVNGDLWDGRIKVLKGSALEKQLMGLQWGLNHRGELVEPRGPRNDAADTLVYGRQLLAEFMTGRGETPPPSEEEKERQAAERPRGVWTEEPAEDEVYESAYDGGGYDDDD